jgi:hypothetical protein
MATENDDTNDILDDEDYASILYDVMVQAGRDGLPKDDVLRRMSLIADAVREWKISAGMYRTFVDGQVRIELTDDESDIRLVASESGRRRR